MRRWILLLMIVLLPLRAAAGDFMSVGMALQGAPAAMADGMSPDCPMHPAAVDTGLSDDDGSAPTSMVKYGSCAPCFPVAQAQMGALVGLHRPAETRHVVADDRFVSVDALGLLRPPRF